MAVEGELVKVNELGLFLLVHLTQEIIHSFSWFSGTKSLHGGSC